MFSFPCFAQGVGLGNWDGAYEAAPAEGDTINLGAGEIRELKGSLSERWDVEHCWGTVGGCTDSGLHREGSGVAFTSVDCSAETVDPAREDGWLCLETAGAEAGLWAEVGLAWFRIGPLPSGTVVIYDNASACPHGYTEYTDFAGLTLRGKALVQGPGDDIPDSANKTCQGSGPGYPPCGDVLAGKYSDTIEIDQLPSHDHTFDYGVAVGVGALHLGFNYATTGPTSSAGTGDPHYHPFRTTLFCRKD